MSLTLLHIYCLLLVLGAGAPGPVVGTSLLALEARLTGMATISRAPIISRALTQKTRSRSAPRSAYMYLVPYHVWAILHTGRPGTSGHGTCY